MARASAELEQQATTTQRVLDRVPQEHLGWKPHPKSMSLGQLALHVATCPGSVAQTTVPNPPAFVQPAASHASELAPTLTASVAEARQLLGGMDDVAMSATWRLFKDGQEVMALTRRPEATA